MRYTVLWKIVVATVALALSVDSSDMPPGQGLDTAGSPNNNIDILRGPRGWCVPKDWCTYAGGHCVKGRKKCDGKLFAKGCKGRKCKCCIPGKFEGPYPNNMIWDDDQCKVITNYYGPTLSECQANCEMVTSCNVINYLEANNPDSPLNWNDSDCILRACPWPVPQPAWYYPPYQGYSLIQARFTGPFDNIWSDDQCMPLATYPDIRLSACMAHCQDIYDDCTAINYLQNDNTGWGSECTLRACPFPIPSPEWINPPYLGYSLSTGFMFGADVETTTTP